MKGFLNKENIISTASVNTDEDDSIIYGKLNKIVEKSGGGVNPYNGLTTDTIEITVDNKNSTIKGDAIVYTEPQEHEDGDFIVGYTNSGTVRSNDPVEDDDVVTLGYSKEHSGVVAFIVDDSSGIVTRELSNNEDVTFTSKSITSLTIEIPQDISAGYTAGFNFSSGTEMMSITIDNQSSKRLHLIENGTVVNSFVGNANCDFTAIIIYTGNFIFCYLDKVNSEYV